MRRIGDGRRGVFQSVGRRRANVAKARRKTVGALVLGVLGVAAGLIFLPVVRVTGLPAPALLPVAWASVGVLALFASGKAVVRLVTGKYRAGRSDFGLPTSKKPKDESRDSLR
ncbi:hypothetical protein HN371_14405 [Candidatus Poribacteria bacterium]|jgi:hypothetical protein|nr:hypothetical protein [Candidatus Poribacteria bacterium]MBT5536006.1 hypothetical protein [Candidatus Poribacteria bacterium]MBT5713808.1 hypothetical protein [Candidatus Poribacteria bacterium]MBT7806504.1 hypothetical protein [Candidatus Poribacteria bacterium]